MKKFAIIILLFMICAFIQQKTFALSDGEDTNNLGNVEDMYKGSETIDNAFYGQKKVTDEDYKKVYEQAKAKSDKRKKINKPFKGQNFNNENSGTYIDETAAKNVILSIPVDLVNGDGTEIPIGLYKIVGKKEGGKVYLDFYQSANLVAHVPAIETDYDFDKIDINFAEWSKYDDKRIKIIYGSMDFNAYTFIKINKNVQAQEN